MIDSKTSEYIQLDEAFEFETSCDSVLGCDKTAHWIWTAPCCGKVLLLCNDCDDICVRMHTASSAANPDHETVCMFCNSSRSDAEVLKNRRPMA